VAIFDSPHDLIALSVASDSNINMCADAVEKLKSDHLVSEYRSEFNPGVGVYDSNTLVKRFVYAALCNRPGDEPSIRRRLEKWYDATDIPDPNERAIEREVRKSGQNVDRAFLATGMHLRRQGRFTDADLYFKKALQINPKNWKALRERGELYRDQKQTGAALHMYEEAVSLIPRKEPERAVVLREYGLLLRSSGMPNAKDRAIDSFEESLIISPNDRICIFALAQTRASLEQWNMVKLLLEPLIDHSDSDTRRRVRSLLLKAYEATHDVVNSANMLRIMDEHT
jgi:tetratricopeptide (TPR) repeat protein